MTRQHLQSTPRTPVLEVGVTRPRSSTQGGRKSDMTSVGRVFRNGKGIGFYVALNTPPALTEDGRLVIFTGESTPDSPQELAAYEVFKGQTRTHWKRVGTARLRSDIGAYELGLSSDLSTDRLILIVPGRHS